MFAGKKHWGCILLLFLLLATLGCSDSAIMEDYGYDYIMSLCGSDDGSGSECTQTVDIVQVMCSATEAEDYYDTQGVVTIVANKNTPVVKITSYTVDYIPEETTPSGDYDGTVFTPPELPQLQRVLDNRWILPGQETTLSFIVLTITHKGIIKEQAAAEGHGTVASPWQYIYTIRLTLEGIDELGERFTISADTALVLYNYDNC